jgi:hypothetical protein
LILFYPETKGKTLEEMDGLFGKLLGDPERDVHSPKSGEDHDGADAPEVDAEHVIVPAGGE